MSSSFTGGIEAPLDADLVDQLVQAEGRGHDSDRAYDRASIGIDLVTGDREQIAARRGDVLGEHIDLETLFFSKRADALVDQHRLHRRAARRIDLDCDRLGAAHGERPLDRACTGRKREPRPERRRHADGAAESEHWDEGAAPGPGGWEHVAEAV
jgi:hypothetical protein